MKGWSFLEERRRCPRYFAPAQFTAMGAFPPQRKYRLEIRDIGIDGFGFVTRADISRENVFSLVFDVTGKDGRIGRINALATIIWYVYDKETFRYTAGSQFLGFKESDRELLQSFLMTLNVKTGG